MKIYLTSGHTYPAVIHGVAAQSVQDDLALALVELGHDVNYQVSERDVRVPPEINPLEHPEGDEDICHLLGLWRTPTEVLPWVRVSHSYALLQNCSLDRVGPNDIAVSKALAQMHNSSRYVHNGIKPDNFVFSGTKDNYLLFVVNGVVRAEEKGLEVAFQLVDRVGVELKVVAHDQDSSRLAEFEKACHARGASFEGMVHGTRKADLFAGARALLFPSLLPEAFGLVIAEALMSGTPVIASDLGAIPELLPLNCGFVCSDFTDYVAAFDALDSISTDKCRETALERYHYHRMARDYLAEYEKQLASS